MPFQTIDIPLGGLNTKPDDYLIDPPGLAVLKDGQFDDVGGIQTRPQYQAILDSASNTIADIRKVAVYGDELVAFSKDKLWSYASGDGLWTERADYLAVKLDETPRFVTTGDQFDCDRAELGGVTMYCWSETTPSGTTSYVAAIDTATGAVKKSPEALPVPSVRCRLTATSGRVHLTYIEGTQLRVRSYNPATLTYSTSSRTAAANATLDVIVDPSDATMILVAVGLATKYELLRYDETATLDGSTTRTVTVSGAVAIAALSASVVAIGYNNGTAIKADIIDMDPLAVGGFLVQVAVDIAVGTASSAAVNQISLAHDGAEFRAFWSAGETTTSTGWPLETNTFSNAGTPGTESSLVLRCGLASRAFVHDSEVFVWAAFAAASEGDLVGQLQNSYFLVRSDGLIVAKAVPTQAGGFSVSQGYLPNVQSLGAGAWAWCGQYRRIIPLGEKQKGYEAKSLQDIVLQFDSDEARRVAQLGSTLYIAGGLVAQYDGQNVVELGFHTFPFALTIVPAAGTGLAEASYNWLQTWEWPNAVGEVDRSTTATIYTDGPFASPNLQANIQAVQLNLTAKVNATAKIWRTVGDAAVSAPFFLVTSKDPASTGDNDYIENDPTAYFTSTFSDELADDALIKREPYPENGGLTLENLSPPAASIILATQDRLLLAGIPGNPHRLVYSKLRGQGEVAAFHDALYLDLPPDGGPITALGFLNETLIIFKETAIYAVPGDGFDNNGGGQNYGPARILNSDVGAESAEAVALTPKGLLFKSSKGWYLLNHGWSASYVGGPVCDFDDLAVQSISVMESQHQVRCAVWQKTLVWDYLVDQWSEWTVANVDALVWNGTHHYINGTDNGLIAQASTHTGAGDLPQLDIETGWIKLAGLQGYKLLRHLMFLARYNGLHRIRVRVAYDYDDTWIDDKVHTPTTTTAGEVIQFRHSTKRRRIQAFKVRLTAVAVGSLDAPVTKAFDLVGISANVKIIEGKQYRRLPKTRKQ